MKRILIIEDEYSLRKGVSETLSFEGFQTFEAENGKTGIQLADEQLPDLILCDIMMPEMDGLTVLSKLRQNESTRLIPFIFMTALAERKNIRYGMELGADDYITKPFTREELLKAIDTRLQKSEVIVQKTEIKIDDLRKRIITHIPHELLTPLNGIIGNSELIAEYYDSFSPEEIVKMSREINKSGERLLNLIRHYIIYIHLTSKNPTDYQKEVIVDPGKRIKDTATDIAQKYNRINDLILYVENNTCLAGLEEFEILITELIENAFKFSKENTPITISSRNNDDRAEFIFHNFGRIFPSGSVDLIGAFIQFERDKFEQQGSGLGLIIAKTIVTNFGGTLEINSSKKEGNFVIVRFPIK